MSRWGGVVMHSRRIWKVEKVMRAAQNVCFLYGSTEPPSKPTWPSPNAPPNAPPTSRPGPA